MAEQIIRTQEFVQAIQEALEANEIRRVREFLAELEPYEISDLLESLPGPVRAELWVHIDSAIEGEVLSHASTAVRNSLLETMEPAQVAEATSGLDSDDVADILQDLPEDVADEILLSMDEQNRQRIAAVLTYPYDTAGGLMNVDAVTVRSDVSIDVVLRYLRRLPRMPENTDQLMVVDRSNTFLGTLRLMALVMASPDTTVGEVMSAEERAIPAATPVSEVALLFEQRDLVSAPVVDDDGKLLGRITIDDVVDVIREESDRSIMSAAGLDEEYDLFAPLLVTARQRALWLAINLGTAFLAAWVIGLFEATIEKLVALAVLMPVVASMGGIAGSQTLTIVVRGLALGQVGAANARNVLTREVTVGVINGCLWALVVAAVAAAWFSDVRLGAVIACAMVVNLFTAGLAGAAIPLLLRRINIDPALAGGVVLTTVTDVVGFFAFLGLAAQFLV
ncbi:MAG: magnesium transporter [Gammaproteobacteria bacterium]